jgi:hydrogenase nickel incorporation protein HypB
MCFSPSPQGQNGGDAAKPSANAIGAVHNHMFRAADIVIITRSDLLPHVDFSIDRCLGNMRAVNRSIRSFVLSAITGEGVGAWHDWLKAEGSAAVQASV